MARNPLPVLFLLALVGLVATPAAPARAQGYVVVPREMAPPEFGPIRVVSLRFHVGKVEVADGVATTTVDQVFHNNSGTMLEGTYVFPLPEGAALDGFSLWMDGKEVKGEVLDAAKARGIYLDIVRRMKDPGLLEFMGQGLFQARIFPIEPNSDKRLKLTYSEVLGREGGLYRYTHPLRPGRSGTGPLAEAALQVSIQTTQPLKTIYSPSHKVDVARDGDRGARVSWEARDVRMDRDFVLYFGSGDGAFGVNLLTHREDPADEEACFALMVTPDLHATDGTVLPKDVVFVFDTSGSMAGEKMQQARAALLHCLGRLRAEDRFAVVLFSTEARPWRDGLSNADEANLAEARRYVEKSEAAGGTNIHEALGVATTLGKAAEEGRPFMVVFMTDGLPTIGEIDPAKILSSVAAARGPSLRLFTFGVGNDLNTLLLDRLAEENRGSRSYVAEGEDIEVIVSTFFDKVVHPVLSDVKVAIDGVWTRDVYPRNTPDLFAGQQVTVFGRYRGEGHHAVRLTGLLGSEPREYVFEASFEPSTANGFIPSLWATRKVGYLVDQIRLHGENPEVVEEVIRLGKKYGIVTPYTSFLVTEDMARPMPEGAMPTTPPGVDGSFGGRGRDEGRRLGAPRAGGASDRGASGASGAPEPRSGLWGGEEREGLEAADEKVRDSEGARRAKEAERLDKDRYADRLQRAGGRTFLLVDGVWVDQACEEMAEGTETRRVVYLSDEWAEMASDPKVAECLALGERVRFVLDGKIVEVAP
ncbi:MAG: VWA domain-containing protein [Planctomycetes bacterium]|nr:VWA domain-containing protein [Planctomycetota bacterium]